MRPDRGESDRPRRVRHGQRTTRVSSLWRAADPHSPCELASAAVRSAEPCSTRSAPGRAAARAGACRGCHENDARINAVASAAPCGLAAAPRMLDLPGIPRPVGSTNASAARFIRSGSPTAAGLTMGRSRSSDVPWACTGAAGRRGTACSPPAAPPALRRYVCPERQSTATGTSTNTHTRFEQPCDADREVGPTTVVPIARLVRLA